MRVNLWRSAIVFGFGVGIISCTEPTGPSATGSDLVVRTDITPPGTIPAIVISQVYGGGGNSGATLKNDFIELFNPGTSAVSVAGWSVQYASAAGTTWTATALTGSIPAGGYYLVQEANGSGGTASLPTPDVIGTLALSATAGKIALSQTTGPLSGACPSGTVDEVSFGTGTPCLTATAAPSNTTSISRSSAGCAITGSSSADFSTGAPLPRNSETAVHLCPAIPNPPATVTISPDPASAVVGSNQTFTATARDASNNVTSTTFTWESSDAAVATISASGVATAVALGTTTIKVTTANGVNTSTTLTVSAAPPGDVVISQVYGGGGNSGATYLNDYVELFNRGTETATITGWTVQYSSAGGSTWNATVLPAATLAPGKYFLLQLAGNAAVGSALPTPDATGTSNLSGTTGKIILTLPGVTPAGISCPTGAAIIDRVGYGTGTNCTDASAWNGNTSQLSNTLAAFRKIDGCTKTGNITNDFIALSPNPHNSASPAKNCNGTPRVQSTATIVINEIMADPANAESASWGEWFEVRNTGASDINLNGWKIVTGGTSQPDHTINANVIVPAGGYAILGRGNDIARNGGVTLDYNYFVGGATTIWLDDADFLELVDAADARVDSVAWTSMPHGVTRGLRDASQAHVDVNGANWGYSTVVFGDGDYGTPGVDNGTLSNTAPIVSANRISISGRVATDAPLPVGFEAQLFATELTDANVVIPTTFTWSAVTPSIASVDSRGVIHALSAGTARFLVTAADGTAKVHALEMITPVASATAVYLDNAAFGEPTDNDATDDFIIHRPQYTTSFNHNLGTPNWVAYDLNATDIAPGQDRCNCFTFDPELETAGFTRYTTADYTGAGAYFGVDGNGSALHGVDRGHMTRSFDRTAGSLDNARTFYFSNVVPQFSDLNQGPWANFENYLGDLAQNQNKEVYIYVGPAGSTGTVKGLGKINFPEYTWKIAVILPRGKGLADVHDYRDVENVIAVIMPNTFGIRNVNWATDYVVTPAEVETLTGYHFFSALDARTQRALKTGTKPPLGTVDGPYNAPEGTSVPMSAVGSVAPNSSIVSYAWSFGDGGVASGATVTHTYANSGSYNVKMIVTDNVGLADTVATTSTVTNVAPTVLAFANANLLTGETYSTNGSFTDPGADVWSATVDYGDGSGSQALALTGKTFSLSHTYAAVGTFTATVTVSDGDATGSKSQIVTVISAVQGIGTLTDTINQLVASGAISNGNGNSLTSKLNAASNQLAAGNSATAINQLNALNNEIDATVKSGRLSQADANTLKTLLARIIAAAGR